MKVFHVVAATAAVMLATSTVSFSQVTVIRPEHEVSRPLRDIKPILPQAEGREEHAVKPVPSHSIGGTDTALQSLPATTSATVVGQTSFPGLGDGIAGFTMTGEPPDTNGSVGATQYVQWVNSMFAVFNKSTGATVYGPANGNTLWSGSAIANGRCASDNSGDPITLYDKVNNRWIMTQFAVSKSPYYQCVAVSKTSDATGAYNLYAYNFGTNFNDYPKVGVWPSGYFFTFNLFARGRTFAGGDMCAMDGATARAGGAATMLCFNPGKSYGGLLPADVDGPTQPSGAEYVMNFGSNSLNVWRLTPNFSAGTMSVTGPTNLPVTAFSTACGGGTCIPQGTTTQQLDSLADRLMYRLAYRQFAGYGSLLVNHSVVAGSSTGVRWYELRDTGAGPAVSQQGTYAPDGNYRWMGSIAQDKLGNIAAGFSVSSSTQYPAIAFASHAPSDAAGSLGGEITVDGGAGAQSGHSRWGDYASISVDPTDDCTMWFTTERMNSSGDFKWGSTITHFKLGTCQ